VTTATVAEAAPGLSARMRPRRPRRPGIDPRPAAIAAAILCALLLLAICAPIVAPYGFDVIDLAHRRAAPSMSHWFGTDELGRDLLTRVIFGARVSLAIGIVSAIMSAAIGVTIGSVAGYAGGWIDDALMRFTDAMLSIPRLPLLMIASAVIEPGVSTLVVLVGLVGWMEMARVVRADVQSIKTSDFVAAARALGVAPSGIIRRHVLPGTFPAVSVAMTIAVGRGILLESAMSFFGVGVQPPTASWGNMLYQAQTTMVTEPWLGIFPGAFIFLTVLCFNVLGDYFRPV
jgi:peptide/nickel transport system permease protein